MWCCIEDKDDLQQYLICEMIALHQRNIRCVSDCVFCFVQPLFCAFCVPFVDCTFLPLPKFFIKL